MKKNDPRDKNVQSVKKSKGPRRFFLGKRRLWRIFLGFSYKTRGIFCLFGADNFSTQLTKISAASKIKHVQTVKCQRADNGFSALVAETTGARDPAGVEFLEKLFKAYSSRVGCKGCKARESKGGFGAVCQWP